MSVALAVLKYYLHFVSLNIRQSVSYVVCFKLSSLKFRSCLVFYFSKVKQARYKPGVAKRVTGS